MTTKKLAGYKELPLCVLEDADRLIARLTKQRAELLEALKIAERKVTAIYSTIAAGGGDGFANADQDVISMRKVIASAERDE